jgi:DNA helicase IV
MLNPLITSSSWRKVELTVNYRTPAVVAQTADRFARAVGLPVSPLVSARDIPGALVTTPVAPDDLADEAAKTADLAVAETYHDGAGRVAVIATPAHLDATAAALNRLGRPYDTTAPGGTASLDTPLVLVTPRQTKGLEFDVAVLVEPAAVLADGGPGDLYVATTRPTQRLHVVHAAPLPPGFDE